MEEAAFTSKVDLSLEINSTFCLNYCRICFCTADRDHPKVFAYIARNKENETMECQAFLCSKRKIVIGIHSSFIQLS